MRELDRRIRADNAASVSDDPENDDRIERLRKMITRPPEKERLALHTFYLQGASSENARRIMGLSRSDRSREHKQIGGLRRLREFIGPNIVRSTTTKIAAGAVIVIAVLAGVLRIGGPDVALAGVLERVEQVHAFMYKIETTVIGRMMWDTPARDTEQEGTNIVSTNYGMK